MFKPLHQNHAIETVIFRLTGSGEMAEHERANLDEGYNKYWKAVLPTTSQAQVIKIVMGPAPLEDETPKSLVPTQYVEFMRTGKPAWWMEIDGSTITIGCAQYGGWKSVSRKAHGLFASVGKTLERHPLAQIRSAELTYQDLFVWDGPDHAYDPKRAIQESQIPERARDSKEWHIGQGWIDDPEGDRILERYHVGALRSEENHMRPVIRVVTTAIWGFGATGTGMRLDKAFQDGHSGNENECGRTVYEDLHQRVKVLFGNLITQKIADQIELNQPGEST